LFCSIQGYGNSSLPVIEEKVASSWLARLIRVLGLTNFVLVSPSMSGRFALPYAIQSNMKETLLRGFVPIAPVGAHNYDIADYKHFNVSYLIVQSFLLLSLLITIEDFNIDCSRRK
jgi:pimeloyl-ACP methyl ester carboxylesterase